MKTPPTISREVIDDILDFKKKAQRAWINTDDVLYSPYMPEWKWTYKDSVIVEVVWIRAFFIIE